MARIDLLKALDITRLKTPGLYLDGRGLYLQITSASSKSWLFRFSLNGKQREMGLGSTGAVTLAQARVLAAEARTLRQAGIDPIGAREAARAAEALKQARTITFQQAADQFIEAKGPGWKNAKHRAQWSSTLAKYAYPVMGDLPIQAVDTDLVLKVLNPIWLGKPETARRIRGRIEQILDWATVRKFRSGDNPARWRGHLKHLLAEQKSSQKHHPALPHEKLPAFMAQLRKRKGISALALEFTILSATRTNETVGARWKEIDFAKKVWTVPPERMKANREHRVPLTEAALSILRQLDQSTPFVFPGGKSRRPLSNMAMATMLDAIESSVTVHGFRSTFRDWVDECTNFAGSVAEMALAHVVKDKTEAAYRRSDLFERRRQLMNAWANHCQSNPAGNTADVVQIRSAS